ncbi:heavy-metal-associated domain-containing protein [Cytobacillus oceanisediminis]|uniref:heavy-metal-associated domain-containing protein n=1 Tax=Cytobacillus oceanisediminis TaxID=665099 RepID=UPI001C22DF0C|nr:heavy-metal-associated domain-containing protein [Cytobacillus oceanisediminis]MBU8769384.1 cation transporter [Cytobacillus oceanisediminis]MCM3392744.1 cation transporter [Cytobacillus oceanisediminis]
MKQLTIFIKEATNEEPIQTLETILMKLDGIERALVDIDDGEVKVTYDERQVGHEKIKNWIEQHGLHLLN